TVVTDPAFNPPQGPFTIHTRWIETEFTNTITPFTGTTTDDDETPGRVPRERLVVEVNNKRLDVSITGGLAGLAAAAALAAAVPRRTPPRYRSAGAFDPNLSGPAVTAPMQGTIVKVAVEENQQVTEGDLIVVLEAMKTEQPVRAHRSGTVKGLTAEVGTRVAAGAAVCDIAP
ncbi:acetyl-CoA carboxylase biotin carboxyl carrier protein subunit, partial [Streptomyces sp.]|uniref:acetyl-CoA carboxylase biotin carboxyl carrier protein subunit n=1 Tax=Streptomyces sp. TaxID=1931 RepID=UPI002F41FF82